MKLNETKYARLKQTKQEIERKIVSTGYGGIGIGGVVGRGVEKYGEFPSVMGKERGFITNVMVIYLNL